MVTQLITNCLHNSLNYYSALSSGNYNIRYIGVFVGLHILYFCDKFIKIRVYSR